MKLRSGPAHTYHTGILTSGYHSRVGHDAPVGAEIVRKHFVDVDVGGGGWGEGTWARVDRELRREARVTAAHLRRDQNAHVQPQTLRLHALRVVPVPIRDGEDGERRGVGDESARLPIDRESRVGGREAL